MYVTLGGLLLLPPLDIYLTMLHPTLFFYEQTLKSAVLSKKKQTGNGVKNYFT